MATRSSKTSYRTHKTPEDFVCDGAPREALREGKPKRTKGSLQKFNSNGRLHGTGYIHFNTCNLVQPKSIGIRCSENCAKIGMKCDSFSEED